MACRSAPPDPGTNNEPAAVSESTPAAEVLAALRKRFNRGEAEVLPAAATRDFQSAAGRLRPRFKDVPTPSARVDFPSRSAPAFRLEDAATGMSVDVTLASARETTAEVAGGYVMYRNGHDSGANVLHRALPEGIEDFLAFETAPERASVAYLVTLGSAVKGLRLAYGVLEMLDAAGAPRLRVAPPYLVGADGTRTDATLAVEGCAVDTNRVLPWGRHVTPPGAATCTVRVRWPSRAVTYPAVLDPRWTTTGQMAVARAEHTATLLSNGKVLVAGGRSTSGTAGLNDAEVYDRTTGTWSSAGTFVVASGTTATRRLHTTTQLGTTSNTNTSGRVLVAGGIHNSTTVTSTSLYNVTANTWTAGPTMAGTTPANAIARHEHTATLLASGNVAIIGGTFTTTALNTAAIYNPGGTGTGSWSLPVNTMSSARRGHTATLLVVPGNATLNNKVLVVGGSSGSSSVNTAQVFDGVNTWTLAGTLAATREGHTATALANGNVLIAGGKTVSGSTSFPQTTQVFSAASGSGTWQPTSGSGSTLSKRFGHTATLLPTAIANGGQVVLLVGGSTNGTDTIDTAETWNGTATWTATSALGTSTPTALATTKGHTATLLANNLVLIAGGGSGSPTTTPVRAAGLYDVSFAVSCSSPSQCATGFCVNGVCCDTACNTDCAAGCNLTGFVGTCRPKTSGTACTDDGLACTADTCNGTAVTCQHPVLAANTTCRAALGECDLAEVCNGSATTCPSDAKKGAGTSCTDDGLACTADTCNGTADACQHPAGNAGTVCRAAAPGGCDVAENCTGTSATCPNDVFAPATTVCRTAASGGCDIAENCTGNAAACPTDTFANSATVCRAAVGPCDIAENCSGSSASCPADAAKPANTVCPDGNVCNGTELCDTAGSCKPAAGIVNGSFETIAAPSGPTILYGPNNTANYQLVPGPAGLPGQVATAPVPTAISGWTTVGTGVEWATPGLSSVNPSPSGGAYVDLAPYTFTGGGIEQTVATNAGQLYELSFFGGTSSLAGRSGTGVIDVLINGVPLASAALTGESTTSVTWQPFAYQFTASGTSTLVTFRNSEDAETHFAMLDGVRMASCASPGSCQGGPLVVDDGNACTADTCNPTSGVSHTPVANGAICDDFDGCTVGDSCQTGTCASGTPKVCTASDSCHGAGTCSSATGQCSNPSVADGILCSDNNVCTVDDTCHSGQCTGTPSPACNLPPGLTLAQIDAAKQAGLLTPTLTTYEPLPAGNLGTVALAINNDGMVAGVTHGAINDYPAGEMGYPFVADPGQRQLASPWTGPTAPTYAVDVNDSRFVVGMAAWPPILKASISCGRSSIAPTAAT